MRAPLTAGASPERRLRTATSCGVVCEALIAEGSRSRLPVVSSGRAGTTFTVTPGPVGAMAGPDRHGDPSRAYQPNVPGPPLNGPTIFEVIQPP
jgi:hypothetical protein